MTVAVATVVTRAATLLNDAGLVQWTQSQLVDWLNEGQLALVKLKPDAKTKTANVTLVAGAKQTDPADAIDIIEIRNNVGGTVITPCDRKSLDQFMPGWMTSTAASTVRHWMDDPQPDTFYVFPPQSGTPATVAITYSAIPLTVAYGGNLDVRDIYADRLVNYVMFRAYSVDTEVGNSERAVAYYNAFAA